MRSKLYECSVMHARFFPKAHRFVYRLFMMSVDLDELANINHRHRLLSIDRGNLFSLQQRDFLPLTEPVHNPTTSDQSNHYGYLEGDKPSLKARVIRYLSVNDVEVDDSARVELVTLPSMFGYRFNPVSFYYIRDSAGGLIAAIVEITNTFHEMKPFLLTTDMLGPDGFKHRVNKNFYISPFADVDIDFNFRLRPSMDRLAVQIDDYEGERRNLATSISGPARPLTDGALAWFVFKYPLLTLRVIFLIHWHALRLWMKRVPWFGKKGRAAEQTELFRPHASIRDGKEPAPPLAKAHQS